MEGGVHKTELPLAFATTSCAILVKYLTSMILLCSFVRRERSTVWIVQYFPQSLSFLRIFYIPVCDVWLRVEPCGRSALPCPQALAWHLEVGRGGILHIKQMHQEPLSGMAKAFLLQPQESHVPNEGSALAWIPGWSRHWGRATVHPQPLQLTFNMSKKSPSGLVSH